MSRTARDSQQWRLSTVLVVDHKSGQTCGVQHVYRLCIPRRLACVCISVFWCWLLGCIGVYCYWFWSFIDTDCWWVAVENMCHQRSPRCKHLKTRGARSRDHIGRHRWPMILIGCDSEARPEYYNQTRDDSRPVWLVDSKSWILMFHIWQKSTGDSWMTFPNVNMGAPNLEWIGAEVVTPKC